MGGAAAIFHCGSPWLAGQSAMNVMQCSECSARVLPDGAIWQGVRYECPNCTVEGFCAAWAHKRSCVSARPHNADGGNAGEQDIGSGFGFVGLHGKAGKTKQKLP